MPTHTPESRSGATPTHARSRRRVVAAAAALVAGIVAARTDERTQAASGDPIKIDQANNGTGSTILTSVMGASSLSNFAFQAVLDPSSSSVAISALNGKSAKDATSAVSGNAANGVGVAGGLYLPSVLGASSSATQLDGTKTPIAVSGSVFANGDGTTGVQGAINVSSVDGSLNTRRLLGGGTFAIEGINSARGDDRYGVQGTISPKPTTSYQSTDPGSEDNDINTVGMQGLNLYNGAMSVKSDGYPNYHYGVIGKAPSVAYGVGVEGDGSYIGVYGNSTGPYGVWGDAPTGLYGVYGTGSYGVYGVTRTAGYAGVSGVTSTASAIGVQGTAVSPATWAGYFSGNVYVSGTLIIGGAKSAAIPYPDGSHRVVYCMESPESWFEDFGDGILANGKAQVSLPSDFIPIIHNEKYYVYVTAEGDSKGLYVANKTTAGFEVHEQQGGTSNVAFSYRIVAKRKDVEAPRLAKAPTLPTVPPADVKPPVAPKSAITRDPQHIYATRSPHLSKP